MRFLTLVAVAACLAAIPQPPARAQDREEAARTREERAQKEIEKALARSREKLLRQYVVANDKIREITIRNSGKKSKGVLVLKYGKDGELVSVIDNGKIVSAKEFPKYKIQLDEAIGAIEIEELRPDLERLEEIIESRRTTDEEKIEALKETIEELKSRESDSAEIARELYLAQLEALGTKRFLLGLPTVGSFYVLEDGDDRMTIKILKDGCYLNGKKLPPDLSDRLLKLWEEYKKTDLDPAEEEKHESGSLEL